MAEAAEKVDKQDESNVIVVTGENFNAYVDKLLAAPEKPAAKIEEKAEEKADEKAEKKEDKKDEKGEKHEKLQQRFSELTKARKDAEAKAETERVARVAAEAKAAELEARLNPPKTRLGERPIPADYTDINEYTAALEKYVTEKANKERDQLEAERSAKAETERRMNAFLAAETKAKEAIKDYEDVIKASEVKVSDEMRDVILDSEFGPELRYHLAKNPEEAERLGKLTVGAMLREVGRLEAKFGSAAKPLPKSEEDKTKQAVELSKAPEPITPLRGAGAVIGLPVDAAGNWTGTAVEFEAARLAGKIK